MKKKKQRNPMYEVKHRSWASNVHESKKTYNRKKQKKKFRRHEV